MATHTHRVAVIGGGFSGTLFALKLAAARPDWTIILIESRARAGRGLAYGACQPQHLLNVPVGRMEIGLEPSFATWLRSRPGFLREALDESKGVLDEAFVPRQLFGDYMEQQLAAALAAGNIRRIHGEVIGIDAASRRIAFADGSVLSVSIAVLATGNLPTSLPFHAQASSRIIADPWRTDVLKSVGSEDSLLLLGTGLTMIDILSVLQARGHKGPIHAVSRHGLLPASHRSGGRWPSFLDASMTPRQAFAAVRQNVRQAERRGIPWQRVFDAARPAVASLWHGWSIGPRGQFLRHSRTLWDVHRHRMAERIAATVNVSLWNGNLTVTAGRVLSVEESKDGLTAVIRPRGESALSAEVDVVINCTGPAMDLRHAEHPLLQNLLHQGLVRPDKLRLGLDTEDCAVIGATGVPSDWIFALGPLTRPAWWEVTAVPEISAQITRLVGRFAPKILEVFRPLTAVFMDIGAGI